MKIPCSVTGESWAPENCLATVGFKIPRNDDPSHEAPNDKGPVKYSAGSIFLMTICVACIVAIAVIAVLEIRKCLRDTPNRRKKEHSHQRIWVGVHERGHSENEADRKADDNAGGKVWLMSDFSGAGDGSRK